MSYIFSSSTITMTNQRQYILSYKQVFAVYLHPKITHASVPQNSPHVSNSLKTHKHGAMPLHVVTYSFITRNLDSALYSSQLVMVTRQCKDSPFYTSLSLQRLKMQLQICSRINYTGLL